MDESALWLHGLLRFWELRSIEGRFALAERFGREVLPLLVEEAP